MEPTPIETNVNRRQLATSQNDVSKNNKERDNVFVEAQNYGICYHQIYSKSLLFELYLKHYFKFTNSVSQYYFMIRLNH